MARCARHIANRGKMDLARGRNPDQHLPRIPPDMADIEGQHDDLQPDPDPVGLEMRRQVSQGGEGVIHALIIRAPLGVSDKFSPASVVAAGCAGFLVGYAA